MKVYVNKITGIDDAIVSMFMSKRSWTRELEEDIRRSCFIVLDPITGAVADDIDANVSSWSKFVRWMDSLVKWGPIHITMLRFINFSITVEGLHRGGQDDWDAHAQRYNNRIIRSSTRLARFGNEMSDFYKGKIMPTDMALEKLDIELPDEFECDGETWKKVVNGYALKDLAENNDVLRGLYMLSIPSNFVFNVNLTEWAHVYKERNEKGGANPEVKECAEAIADQLEKAIPWFTRDLFMAIKN